MGVEYMRLGFPWATVSQQLTSRLWGGRLNEPRGGAFGGVCAELTSACGDPGRPGEIRSFDANERKESLERWVPQRPSQNDQGSASRHCESQLCRSCHKNVGCLAKHIPNGGKDGHVKELNINPQVTNHAPRDKEPFSMRGPVF